MESKSPPRPRVILWSAARCISTAVERSIRTLRGGKIFHEPFMLPYCSGPERQTEFYAKTSPIVPGATYQSVLDEIKKAPTEGKTFVFVKDLASSCKNFFMLFQQDEVKDFQHSFLIRHPAKSILSFSKCPVFDPEEAGFKEMLELYEFVEQNIHPSPVVIDADDLLEFPDDVMRGYCAGVGLEYNEGMTRWEPGPVEGWDQPVCRQWHAGVVNSSGFVKRKKEPAPDLSELPKGIVDAVKKNVPYYEALYEKRMLPH